jgi:hypothetical protein
MSHSQTNEAVHSDTDEAEGLAAASEQERDLAIQTDQYAMEQTASEGVLVRRAFTMKNFLPNTGYLEWITQNVVAKGAGSHVIIGRIFGMVYASEHKENKYQDKVLKSIALSGDLQAQTTDGKITTFDMLFLPMAFATRIDRAIQAGAHSVELDVDIGIEATGKSIPYAYTVTSYLAGRAERVLRKMANSRRIGEAAPSAVRQIAAPLQTGGTTIEGDREFPDAPTEKVTARRGRA